MGIAPAHIVPALGTAISLIAVVCVIAGCADVQRHAVTGNRSAGAVRTTSVPTPGNEHLLEKRVSEMKGRGKQDILSRILGGSCSAFMAPWRCSRGTCADDGLSVGRASPVDQGLLTGTSEGAQVGLEAGSMAMDKAVVLRG